MPQLTRLAFALAAAASLCHGLDLTQFVLPNMGDVNGGNTFPGVSLPLGVVKIGPDLYTGSDSYSGYQSTGNFIGFSLLHESGTGGAPKYGVVSQMPVLGSISNPLVDLSINRSTADVTRLGYYKSTLFNGITVELGATGKAGMYQYQFPEGHGASNVVVDVSHVLSSYRGQGLGQNYLGGNITVTTTSSGIRYTGAGSYNNGWNRAPKWTVFFCGSFDQPATFKTFLGSDATGTTLVNYGTSASQSSTARVGAIFTFNSTSVTSRVGVSFISSSQACSNLDREIPEGTALSTLETNVKSAWADGVLSRITTTDTANTTKLQLLYSSLYHFLLIPTNKTGENPLWVSKEPYYDDIFTFWDTFRCGTPLLHVLQPTFYEEFIRSTIDIWRFAGFMPDARSSFFNGASQGGSNADNVLADAYVKGVRGAINWDDGFAAMVTNAETVPPNNNDPRDLSSSTKEGRGALPDWIQYGYITTKYGRSVSRAIEYAVNDFSLYQVATGLNNSTAAAKYLQRSRNWRNQWNPSLRGEGRSAFPSNGIEFESLGPDIKITDPGSVEEGDELDPDFTRQRSKASPAGPDSDVISSAGENLHRPRWFPFQKEYRAHIDPVPDSSEEEDVGSTINHAYDQMFGNADGFPFAVGGQPQSVTELHPSGVEILGLWQTYLGNVDPLLKLTHAPTLQAQIIEASRNLTKVSKSLEALMFAIYLMAITSLTDDEANASAYSETVPNLGSPHSK
ncbi:hypothetical protein ONZ43_g6330 [Nemania bipapillata]|uniref:Uncharacterized protein n=1 Tax=Nemania bipapillata TaxID=110536 RepID=A0ACC2I154_9PEZI|nr:hypothetical protein ONZ43_g6330 [Nemania bipapillata]